MAELYSAIHADRTRGGRAGEGHLPSSSSGRWPRPRCTTDCQKRAQRGERCSRRSAKRGGSCVKDAGATAAERAEPQGCREITARDCPSGDPPLPLYWVMRSATGAIFAGSLSVRWTAGNAGIRCSTFAVCATIGGSKDVVRGPDRTRTRHRISCRHFASRRRKRPLDH